MNGNVINNSSVVVRKEIMILIGGVNEEKEMIGCEDYNTWLKILFLSSKILKVIIVLPLFTTLRSTTSLVPSSLITLQYS